MRKTMRSGLGTERTWLYTKYVLCGMPCKAIAELCDVHPRTIHQRLVKYGIPRRRTGYIVQSEEMKKKRRLLGRNDPRIIAGLKKAIILSKTPEAILKSILANSGANHWNWKGGISSYRPLMANRREYKLWRNNVFKRDNYTCQICSQRGYKLQAHHIIPVCENSELILDPNNGITLCLNCHSEMPKHKVVLNAQKTKKL